MDVPKKKHFRYYESYIPKFMKQNFNDNGLTLNAKKQLNSALCFVSEQISTKAKTMTRVVNKKTIHEGSSMWASMTDSLFVDVMKRNTEALAAYATNSDSKKVKVDKQKLVLYYLHHCRKIFKRFQQ